MATTLKVSIIFVCFFCCKKANSQETTHGIDLGEGIVSIAWYSFPPQHPSTRALSPDSISRFGINNMLRYYIKTDKVLRKDMPDSGRNLNDTADHTSSNGVPVEVHTIMTVTLQHPTYLIDYKRRKTCFIADSSRKTVEYDMQDNMVEVFYRYVNDTGPFKVSIVSLADASPVLIAGKKCYEGRSLSFTGENEIFYYTKEPLSVRSPLNSYFPDDFPYNVLRFSSATQWSNMDGTVSNEGLIIFQVSEIKECSVADSLLVPPINPFHIK
jgi:hypothetical protein